MLPWNASVELISWNIIGYCHCQSEEERRATSTGMRERTHLIKGLEDWGGKEKSMVIGLYTGIASLCQRAHGLKNKLPNLHYF
jgi:hypothetical protein